MPKSPSIKSPNDNPPDPAAAKKAYEAMTPRMAALAKDDLALLNVDAQEVAIIALSISRFLAEPEPSARRERFKAQIFQGHNLLK